MDNKLLADLIKERLNIELEKIKTDLSKNSDYASDINDSVEAVRKQLGVEAPTHVVQTPEPERIVQHNPIKIHEITLDGPTEPSAIQEIKTEEKASPRFLKKNATILKIAAVIILLALIASTYLYFF